MPKGQLQLKKTKAGTQVPAFAFEEHRPGNAAAI